MTDPRIEALLRKYVKTSQVKARPMTRTEYGQYTGLCQEPDINAIENNEPGFLVLVSDHNGNFDGPCEGGGWHVIWVSAETFSSCYAPQDLFNFGHAMLMRFKGFNVSRAAWGWNTYLIILESGDISLTGEWVNGTRPWVGLHRVDGSVEPYTPTQEDMMATDWRVVSNEKTDFKKLGVPSGENWWR